MVFQPGERRGLVRGRPRQVAKVLESMIQQRLNVKRRRKVRRAVVARPIATAVRAIVASPLGRGVIRKVGLGRFLPGSAQNIARSEAGLGFTAGPRGLAIRTTGAGLALRVAKPVAKVAAIGGTFAVGEEVAKRVIGRSIFDTGPRNGVAKDPFGPIKKVERRPMPSRNGFQVGQTIPPEHTVVRTWETWPGGPRFARMADGHIIAERKDGTLKHYRPYRPVVVPRKWDARAMSRVATALKRQRKTAQKIMQLTGGLPKGRK